MALAKPEKTMSQKITIPAVKYEDYDDCLSAAADEYAKQHGLEGWDLDPKWEDDQRDMIVLTVPNED